MYENGAPSETLGPYEILGTLGAGGMGEVFLAHDPRLDRRIAIKMLPTAAAADPERVHRFEREARALAALSHPNIVTIYSVEEAGGRHFYTMELVEGATLTSIIPPAGMPVERLLSVAVPLVTAIEAAHGKGIVHRDLKPGNVMVTPEGTVKVLDFGLAKIGSPSKAAYDATTRDEPATHAGQVLGTYPYMSPEQIEGRRVDHRSDLFSLGTVLYEMATGRRPFVGDTLASLAVAILRGEPSPPRAARPDLPERLADVISRCLRKDAGERVQSAAEVRAELERVVVAVARPASAPDRPSIVVLPFANMSADPEQEYFCDGLAEEVINALTRIEGLHVVARTSAFAFKGKLVDVREIGRTLGVRAVLEGSVRRAGDRVRINAQLIDVANGFHHWSERFDRTLADVFAIQDEISLAIVEKLRVHLRGSDRERLTRRATENKEAHEALLKGRFFFYRRRPGDLELALEQYRLAASSDAAFAMPHACVAEVFSALGLWGMLPPRQAFGQARAAAARAIELDAGLAEGHLEMGFVLLIHDWDVAGAERCLALVRELGLESPIAHAWYSYYLAIVGRREEVLRSVARAVELDPLNPAVLSAAGAGLLAARFDADAAGLFERALELAPEFANAQAWLGRCRFLAGDYAGAETLLRRAAGAGLVVASALLVEVFARAGRLEEAVAVREAIERAATSRYVQRIVRAMAAAAVGDLDAARAHFEQAIVEHEPGVLIGRALRSPALQELVEPLIARHETLRATTTGAPPGGEARDAD